MSHTHKHKSKSKEKKKSEKKKPLPKPLPSPKAKNVERFLACVVRKAKKRREQAEKDLERYIIRYHLKGKNTENYWRLKGICVLIGKERF
jgi:hypothetical protein